MSTLSPSIVLAATTPQQHYNWIAAFSAALDSLGITRTSDTGQIVLTGISSIALPNEPQGDSGNRYGSPAVYEIRKLAAAGLPTIYLRFDYGVYANDDTDDVEPPYSFPTLQVSVGASTDGAGNIQPFQTGSGVPTFASGNNQGSNNYYTGSSSSGSRMPSPNGQECDFASDGANYLTIMLGENAPAFETRSIFCFGLERSIDPSTGLYNGNGIIALCGHNAGNSNWMYADCANSQQWNGNGGLPAITPPFPLAGNVNVVDLFPFVGSTNIPQGAPTVALSYYATSISSPVAFPAQLYSAPHTYKACPRSLSNADPYNTGTKLALRFD
jgi:hypothetical protein